LASSASGDGRILIAIPAHRQLRRHPESIAAAAAHYLFAVQEAARIYQRIAERKGEAIHEVWGRRPAPQTRRSFW
jgi:hypothetical protein